MLAGALPYTSNFKEVAMQPDAPQIIPSEVERAQIQLALEWERRMNRAFKGIYPKNASRKALARRAAR